MDLTRERFFEQDKHTNSTNKIETGSKCSSDCDQNHNACHQKRPETNPSKQFYPPVPDYFPMYSPTWAAMNYVYLDLLRKLSLESEIRSSLSKMDQRFDCNCLKDSETKQPFEKDETCCNNCLKHTHKPLSCRDFVEPYSQLCSSCHCDNDCVKHKHKPISCKDFKEPYPQMCLSCHRKIKCSSCGQTISKNKEPMPFVKEMKRNHCKYEYVCDSCPTLFDTQQIPSGHGCHYCHTKHPCHALSHSVCSNLVQVPVEIPVREKPECYESARMIQKSLGSQVCFELDSNSEEEFGENYLNDDKSTVRKDVAENQPEKQTAHKDDLEDNCRAIPSFFGGTGDEGSKPPVNRTRKSRQRSTAYFLPISSLSNK